MVIDEKGLVKAMKASYKDMGYKVAASQTPEKQIMISGNGFCAVIQAKFVPRKALGMIAEHLGFIPAPGQGFQLQKGVDAQTEIYGMTYETAMDHFTASGESPEVARTQLTLNENEIWQRKDTLECRMVSPKLREILSYCGNAFATPDGMVVEGEVSRIWIACAYTDSFAVEDLRHLSKRAWTK